MGGAQPPQGVMALILRAEDGEVTGSPLRRGKTHRRLAPVVYM